MKILPVLAKWLVIMVATAAGVLTGATAVAQASTNQLRVGVYDSRAIAIAYANSPLFAESLKSAQAEYERARKDQNEKQMQAIESRMKLRQRRTHEQAFSTGSVAGCLAKIKDSLPAVAKQANV